MLNRVIAVAATAALAGGMALAATAVAKPGDYIVGDSSDSRLYRVNPTTGGTTTLSDDPRLDATNDPVFGPNGLIYFVDYESFSANGAVFSYNPKTHATKVVSQDEQFTQPVAIARAPSGDLFVADIGPTSSADDGAIFRVNPKNGNTKLINTPAIAEPGAIVIPPNGKLIVSDLSDPFVYRVNPGNGGLTTIANESDGLVAEGGMTRAPDGTLYLLDIATDVMQSIDPATGEVEDAGENVSTEGYGLSFDFCRNEVISTDGNDLFGKVPGSNTERMIDGALTYPEGLEVEPPRCLGRTATITGTNGKDVLKGSKFADVIAGLGGGDKITGLGKGDRICGGGGADSLNGGSGSDRCQGGPGKDAQASC